VAAVFDFRIRPGTGVFSDDSADHEIESSGKMAPQRGFPGFGDMFKYLKSQPKTVEFDFFATLKNSVDFCTRNDSKALALCAARSHIVAVR
jgi:hypothetical protein